MLEGRGPRGGAGRRKPRLAAVTDASRRLAEGRSRPAPRPQRGRIWLNGRELGDERTLRFAQLSGSHD